MVSQFIGNKIMWKFKFDAPKGSRLMKQGFIWVTCFPTDKSSDVRSPNWNANTSKWVFDNSWTSTSGEGVRPRCFRAFKRYLRKHPELQVEGIDVVLVNRYYCKSDCGEHLHDYNIIANWVES